MKKRTLIISALCICLLCVVGLVIYAVDNFVDTITGIYVAGERISTENASGDGWSYDFESNILTLNEAMFTDAEKQTTQVDSTTKDRAFIYVDSSSHESINIRIKGAVNTLGNSHLPDSEYYTGSGKEQFKVYGIWAPGVSVTIDSLSGQSESSLYLNTNCHSIYCDKLILKDVSFNANSFDDPVLVRGDMEMYDSFVEARGHVGMIKYNDLYDKYGSVVYDCGAINVFGELAVNDSQIGAWGTLREENYKAAMRFCGVTAKEITVNGEDARVYGYAIPGDIKGSKYNGNHVAIGIRCYSLEVGGGAYVYGCAERKTNYCAPLRYCGITSETTKGCDITFTGSGTIEGETPKAYDVETCCFGIETKNITYQNCILESDDGEDSVCPKCTWNSIIPNKPNKTTYETYHRVISATAETTLYVRENNGKLEYSKKDDFSDAAELADGTIDMSGYTYEKYDRENDRKQTMEYSVIVKSGSVKIKPTSNDDIVRGLYTACDGASLTVQTDVTDSYPTTKYYWGDNPSIRLSLGDGASAYITGGGEIKYLQVDGKENAVSTSRLFIESGTICGGSVNNTNVYMAGGNNNIDGEGLYVYSWEKAKGDDGLGTAPFKKSTYDFGDTTRDMCKAITQYSCNWWNYDGVRFIDGKLYLWNYDGGPLMNVTLSDGKNYLVPVENGDGSYVMDTPKTKIAVRFDDPTTTLVGRVGDTIKLDAKGYYVKRTYNNDLNPVETRLEETQYDYIVMWYKVDSRTGNEDSIGGGNSQYFSFTIDSLLADDEFVDFVCKVSVIETGEVIGKQSFRVYVMNFKYLPEDVDAIVGENIEFEYTIDPDCREIDGVNWRDYYTADWQYSTDGGTTWTTIDGAYGSSYSVEVTEDYNFDTLYRLHFRSDTNKLIPVGIGFPTLPEFDSNSFKINKTGKPDYGKIEYAEVMVGQGITMKYHVSDVEIASDKQLMMRFTICDYVKTVAPSGYDDDGNIIFLFEDISSQYMTENIKAEFILADSEGNYISTFDTLDYSIVQYAKEVLSDADSSDELKQVISEMLRYGAAAQLYKGYNVDGLAKDIAGVTLATEVELGNIQNVKKLTTAEGVELGNVRFKSAAVWFDNECSIYLKLGDYTENTKLRVTRKTTDVVTGNELTSTVEYDIDSIHFYTESIAATQFDDVFTFELYEDGVLQQTLVYSVSSYVSVKMNGTDAMAELAKSFARWGIASKDYVLSQNSFIGGIAE